MTRQRFRESLSFIFSAVDPGPLLLKQFGFRVAFLFLVSIAVLSLAFATFGILVPINS